MGLRVEMSQEKPLLSDFLEELKVYKEGVFLDKTISIFYNDWSLNPYYDVDDYSERVTITITKLKNLNSKEYKSYRVSWWDQSVYVSNLVQICVQRIKDETVTLSDEELALIHEHLMCLYDLICLLSWNDTNEHKESSICDVKNMYKHILEVIDKAGEKEV